MFGKLLKHEFRATAPLILMLWAGLAGFAGLSALFWELCRSLDIFALPLSISMFFFVILAIAAVVVVNIVIIRRFYVNVYGDEGYLTLTLPVKRSSIIWSKLVCSSVWLILTGAVVAISVGVLLLVGDRSVISDTFEYLRLYVGRMLESLRISEVFAAVVMILAMLVELVSGILVFYASISIGQFFTGHRLLGSVLGYMGIHVLTKIAESIYSLIMGVPELSSGLINMMMRSGLLDAMSSFNLQVAMVLYIVVKVIFAALLFFFSDYIMRRQVNLQ